MYNNCNSLIKQVYIINTSTRTIPRICQTNYIDNIYTNYEYI